MPTYHFRCRTCGTETQVKLAFGSKDLPVCETCKQPMEKFIVPPMVHFKGTGFYKTDSSAGTPKKAEAPKAPDPPKKSDSPPATP